MNLLELGSRIKRSLLSNVPIGLRLRFGLYDSSAIDRDVDYALRMAKNYLSTLNELKVVLPGLRVLELGPGLNFAPMLALASVDVKVVVADRFLTNWNTGYHPEFYRRFKERWDGATTAIEAVLNFGGYPADVIRCVHEPAETLRSLKDSSCDVVLSNAVLEHVYDLPAVCVTLARVTKAGGYGIHQIDFRDHWNFHRPLEFLLHGTTGWQLSLTRGRVGRGNRYRLSDHIACFQRAGFEIASADVNLIADPQYLDSFLPRLRGSKSPYRSRPEADLTALSARISMVRV